MLNFHPFFPNLDHTFAPMIFFSDQLNSYLLKRSKANGKLEGQIANHDHSVYKGQRLYLGAKGNTEFLKKNSGSQKKAQLRNFHS